jgi:hypothetical protein
MLLNTYLESLRVRKQYAWWADAGTQHQDTVPSALPPMPASSASPRVTELPVGLAGLVNLASVRATATAPDAQRGIEVSTSLLALVRMRGGH